MAITLFVTFTHVCGSDLLLNFTTTWRTKFRDKYRQFYIDKTVTYQELVSALRLNVPSLAGFEFQIVYINDGGTKITLYDNNLDVADLFRCSTAVINAEYRRVKISIIEGSFPAIQENRKQGRRDCDGNTSGKPPTTCF